MKVIEIPTAYHDALRNDGTPECWRALVEMGAPAPGSTQCSLIYVDRRHDDTRAITGNFLGLTRWVEIGDWVVKQADGKLLHLTNDAFAARFIEIEEVL